MKATRVEAKNVAAIEAALYDVNASATEHTYTTFDELDAIAQRAEKRLAELNIRKADRTGAVMIAMSGKPVPVAYNHDRRTTYVRLERRATGWFITDLSVDIAYSKGGYERLYLTHGQKSDALRMFSEKLRVL